MATLAPERTAALPALIPRPFIKLDTLLEVTRTLAMPVIDEDLLPRKVVDGVETDMPDTKRYQRYMDVDFTMQGYVKSIAAASMAGCIPRQRGEQSRTFVPGSVHCLLGEVMLTAVNGVPFFDTYWDQTLHCTPSGMQDYEVRVLPSVITL